MITNVFFNGILNINSQTSIIRKWINQRERRVIRSSVQTRRIIAEILKERI